MGEPGGKARVTSAEMAGGPKQDIQKSNDSGEDTEEEDKGGEGEGEPLRGAPVEIVCVGGECPPRRKTRTRLYFSLNVCTYCCRESAETSYITTTGRTWMGESSMTLFGSVVVTSWPCNWLEGMPYPMVH